MDIENDQNVNQDFESAQKAFLVFNSQIFPIKKPTVSIGRKLDNDLVIHEKSVSRHHAEIRFEENQFVLYDLGSTGGTFINSKKTNRGILFAGDIILLSNIPLMFMAEGASLTQQSDEITGQLKD